MITGAASADGGTINLISNSGSITESGVGALSTTGTLTTMSNGGQFLSGANTIANFNSTNSGSGDVVLTNTASPLNIIYVNQTGAGGNIAIENTGAIRAGDVSPIEAKYGTISLVAHSPIYIGSQGLKAQGDINLTAGSPGSTSSEDKITVEGPVASTGSGRLIYINNVQR